MVRPMTDAAEFRKRAQECLDMAPRFGSESRLLLVSISEAWLALAEAELLKESALNPPPFSETESDTKH